MREYWFEEKEERQIRKNFIKAAETEDPNRNREIAKPASTPRFFTRCISTNQCGSHPPAGNRAGEPSLRERSSGNGKTTRVRARFVGIFDKLKKR